MQDVVIHTAHGDNGSNLERFTKAVANVETIADWLSPEETDNIDGMAALLAAQEAYQQYGDEETFLDELYKQPNFIFDPDIEQTWPESKGEFQQRFPRLFEVFWQPNKIKK